MGEEAKTEEPTTEQKMPSIGADTAEGAGLPPDVPDTPHNRAVAAVKRIDERLGTNVGPIGPHRERIGHDLPHR